MSQKSVPSLRLMLPQEDKLGAEAAGLEKSEDTKEKCSE